MYLQLSSSRDEVGARRTNIRQVGNIASDTSELQCVVPSRSMYMVTVLKPINHVRDTTVYYNYSQILRDDKKLF